jgi:hypothetical protein
MIENLKIMEEKILFEEKQQFRQWWLWLLLLGLNAYIFYKIFLKNDSGNDSKTAGIISIIVTFSLLLLFYVMKLKTKIYRDSIEVKFFPFGIHKTYSFQEIEKMEVIKYNPIMDYGGWGIRIGAYNISGNKGLKINYKNKNSFKDSILIGTQKPEELSKIIKSIQYV